MNIQFKSWSRFHAEKDLNAIRIFLYHVGDESFKAFQKGMRGKHSGRIYKRKGRSHRASAPGEFPAIDSGALISSMDTVVTDTKITIGTNMFYSKFLAYGTSKMSYRKMSIDAIKLGIGAAPKMGHFARWKRV